MPGFGLSSRCKVSSATSVFVFFIICIRTSDSNLLPSLCYSFASLASAVHDAEESRYKKQRGHSRKQKTAYNRPAQGRVLLAALAQTQRHWHHANHHRQGCHQHRSKTSEAGLKRGRDCVLSLEHLLFCEADNENAVGCGDAHAHDRSGKGRHAESGVSNK